MARDKEDDKPVYISRGALISGVTTLIVTAIIGTVSMFMTIRVDMAEQRTLQTTIKEQLEKRNELVEKLEERVRSLEKTIERLLAEKEGKSDGVQRQ